MPSLFHYKRYEHAATNIPNEQSPCVASSDILNELLQRENRVLHFWTMRKRRLDQCQQYVVFERSAKQVCVCVTYVCLSIK